MLYDFLPKQPPFCQNTPLSQEQSPWQVVKHCPCFRLSPGEASSCQKHTRKKELPKQRLGLLGQVIFRDAEYSAWPAQV